MHLAFVPMAPGSYQAARDRFTRDRIDQRRRVDALRDARRDLALLEDLEAGRRETPVRGAGLFDPARAADPDAEALRRHVTAALGPGFLDPEPILRAAEEAIGTANLRCVRVAGLDTG